MPSNMELKRISASPAPATGVREATQLAKLIDTTTCIGCKACEVACQEWNDLLGIDEAAPPSQVEFGSYQTQPDLTANFWNLIRFNEHVERNDDGSESFRWLMAKDQCQHCAEPGCLEACPSPGAIVQYANGIVDFQQENCIGCEYCVTGCPQFGVKEQLVQIANHRVNQLKADGRPKSGVYDPPGVGGTGVIYVLEFADRPELYGLPKDPKIPRTITIWKKVLKPLGSLAMAGALVGAVFHYLRFGRNEAPDLPKDEKEESNHNEQ